MSFAVVLNYALFKCLSYAVPNVRIILSDTLVNVWKDAMVTYCNVQPQPSSQVTKRDFEISGKNSRPPSRGSKPGLAKCEAQALINTLRYSAH
jgi:hypothetical protein